MEKQEKKRIDVVEMRVCDLNYEFDNPRKPLTPKRKKDLEESLEKLGDFGVIVIDENNSILSGNQRVKILMALDPNRKVLCKRLVGYTDGEKKAVNIKANVHAGEWDMKKLAEWTGSLHIDLSTDLTVLNTKEPKIKDMELIRYEKYDYVMIVCRNEVDYNNLIRSLGIEDKKVLVAKTRDKDRKIKARAIWYDDMKAQIVPKKKKS